MLPSSLGFGSLWYASFAFLLTFCLLQARFFSVLVGIYLFFFITLR